MLAVGDRWIEARALARQATRLREEVLAARAENERLQVMITEARSDRAIETIAREELNLIRPGETAVILIAPTAMPTARATPSPATTPVRP